MCKFVDWKIAVAVAAFVVLSVSPLARAEAPMNTDDAGTLDRGGMKVESVWSKDDKTTGGALLFGFSPVENLEMEVAVGRAKDGSVSPADLHRGVGFGLKWVPWQNDKGWSIGARFDYGHTRITDYLTPHTLNEREYALTGLASYRFANDQVLHLNLGVVRVKAQGESDSVGAWGVGYELPLAAKLQLTVEAFGQDHAHPDKAIGLRYEVFDGFKASGAIGRGNDRGFGQVGVAWEF